MYEVRLHESLEKLLSSQRRIFIFIYFPMEVLEAQLFNFHVMLRENLQSNTLSPLSRSRVENTKSATVILFMIVTIHNEVAKVMFLHLSVILFTGGSASVHTGTNTPHPSSPIPPGADPSLEQTRPLGAGTSPQEQAAPPRSRHPQSRPLLEQTDTRSSPLPPGPDTPPSRRLLLQTVRILLECILVVVAGSLEAAYSLNWGAREIWGKGGGETLALL